MQLLSLFVPTKLSRYLLYGMLYGAAQSTRENFQSPPCSPKAIGSVPGRPRDHRMCLRSIWGRAVHPGKSREVACRVVPCFVLK